MSHQSAPFGDGSVVWTERDSSRPPAVSRAPSRPPGLGHPMAASGRDSSPLGHSVAVVPSRVSERRWRSRMGDRDGRSKRRRSRPRKSCAGCCTADHRILQQVELGSRTVWLCCNCRHIIENDITTPTTILSLKAAIHGSTRITPWPKPTPVRSWSSPMQPLPELGRPGLPVR